MCRQEQSMSRFPLFFVLSALAFIAMIGFALRPLLPQKDVVVEARLDKGNLVFDQGALNKIVSAEGFPVTPAPGPRADQQGPRLASVSALAPGAQFSKGARLMLGPQTQAAISGRNLTILVYMRSLANTPATKTAIGFVTEGPIDWVEGNVTSNFSAQRYVIPAATKPASALALWPATEGQGHGIEIKSIVIQITNETGAP
jgi:hypothetical protein